MHQSSFNIMTRFRKLLEKQCLIEKLTILDVGSHGINGTYKEIFFDSVKYVYTGLDVNPGSNVDYVPSDPYDWPELQDESFDVIISGQAFEHIEYPWLIIEEMNRVLKKNGLICIVAPSRGPEHKYPVDCWRYYPDGFRALAKWANLEVLDAQTTWGKSGFADGSDQWGDTFCILYKPENRDNILRKEKKAKRASRSANLNNPMKQNKQDSYYAFARPDVVEAILKNNLPTGKVLEIGCAGGATGKNIKERLPVQSYVGIDISPEAAGIAKNHLDRVIVADIENTDLASEHGLIPGEFDLLLALDVLEHLYDPWDSLAELSRYVKPGGYVVASIPNIQNITIVQDLIKGNWQYQDAGILDATHLRFFTLETSKMMFSGAGLIVKGIERIINPSLDIKKVKESGNKYRHENLEIANLTKKELLDLFAYQYILITQKTSSTEALTAASTKGAPPGGDPIRPHFKQDSVVPGLTSIVILTFNQLEYTKKCVKSLHKHTLEPHEIIFVDNGSTDGTLKWLRTQAKENKSFTLVENKQNLGFAQGCNQGMEASRGEFILLLNNDIVVAEGWLTGMLDCLNHAPEAGIIGPMTNNISGLQQINDDAYRSVDFLDKYATKFREQYRHRRMSLRRIVGFCMLFKRSLVEQIGMLDESFGTGNFEDDDFCLRAALMGYKNYIAGDIFIHHFGSRSFIGNRINYGGAMSTNRKIIEQKWTLSTASPEGKKLAVLRATELANEFFQRGDIDQAVEALINCIKFTPDAKEIYFELARIFIETKRFSEAWEVIESMPEEVRESLKGLEYAGYIKEGLGLDDEAAGYTGRMLGLHEKYAPALNLRGVLAYKKDEKEQAAEYFKKAIDADPGYGEGRTNLGILKWNDNRKDEAIKDLKRGFILAPLVPDHSTLYYSAVSLTDRFAEAEAVFQDARRLYPNSKSTALLFIDILIRQCKWEAAMMEIEDAMVAFNLDEGMLNAALAVREHLGPPQIDKAHAKKNTLSLCMIVKNEEKNLARCLKSVRDVVDEMIVVDTGSTDKTMDIARSFGARIFEFPWTGDFSAARNVSLEKATGDWIFVLDADEVISARDFDELRALIRKSSSSPAAYSIFTRNYTRNVSVIGWSPNSGQCPEEAGAGWATSAKVRLFKRRKDVFFSNPVHEMVEDSLRKAKIPFHPCKIVVHHYGKLDLIRDSQKGEDYYLLGKMKYESDPTNVKYINELAKQAQVLNKYEEAVELWQKLISLVDPNPESPSYKEIARISYGNPLSEMYIQMASAQLMLDRYEEALMAARKAMETKIRRVEYVHVYAHCEIIAGSLEKAFSALEDLLETTPEYPPALFMMAVIFYLEEQEGKANELFQLLLQKGVRMTPLLNTTAKQLHGHGKRDEALRILNATVENRIGDEETTSLRDALLGSQGSA
jgi:GT2 family glycosyltransferase/SAM-dependent methyltransferase/Tfp pilus assembly protein PilF